MTSVTIDGGSNSTTSRTATLYFAETTVFAKLKIPVVLDDTGSYTKKATVTVTIGTNTYTSTADFEKTEQGERTVDVTLGYEVQESTEVKVKFTGTRARINYNTYTYPVVCHNGVSVTANAFNFTIEYDTSKVWQMTNDNEGYPWRNIPPDTSEFNGYQDPKPRNSWKIDCNNEGYPWTWGFSEISYDNNLFLKTKGGLIPLTAYYKKNNEVIPLVFMKQ